MKIANRNNLPMREYWETVVMQFGGYYSIDEEYWYVPAFPNSKVFSKTKDIYTAYVLTLDAIKLKTKNQG